MENKTNYVCRHTSCVKRFLSRSSRIYHEKDCKKGPLVNKKKATKEGSVLKCRFCNETFKHVSSVSRHQKDDCNAARLLNGKPPKIKIPKPTSYSCQVCERSFDRPGKLKRHELIHQKKKYVCEVCSREFKRKDHFVKHACSVPDERPSFVEVDELPSFVNLTTTTYEDESFNVDVDEQDGDVAFVVHHKESVVVNVSEAVEAPGEEAQEVHCEEEQDVEELVVDASEEEDIIVVYPNDYEVANNNDGFIIPDDTSNEEGRDVSNENNDVEESEGYVFNDEFSQYFTNCVLGKLAATYKHKSNILMELLYEYLGDDLYDENVYTHIYKALGIRKYRFLIYLEKFKSGEASKRTNPKTHSIQEKQTIYDTWINHAIVTVDRRNGRDSVTMRKDLYLATYGGIDAPKVSFSVNKRKVEVAKATRYIAIKTVREIRDILEGKGLTCSLGSIFKYCPFFVCVATEREKLECLCQVCINARTLFKVVMKTAEKELNVTPFVSITNYLVNRNSCKIAKSGYIDFNCINGKCSTCHGIIGPSELNDLSKCDKMVKYYQFEGVEYETQKQKEKRMTMNANNDVEEESDEEEEDDEPAEKTKKKKKKQKRTERVNYNTSIKECKEKLDKIGKLYLLHRYDVEHDKYIWPLIRQKAAMKKNLIAHCDYSESLQEIPKFQSQDMHFNKRSVSLHCTVVHQSEDPKDNRYLYHFCDMTKHGWAHTSAIDRDWQEVHFTDKNIIRKKSDNCSKQYKSLHVFGDIRRRATNEGNIHICYYGAAGHGRGLVDSMSSFGVKGPLRKEIINHDYFYSSAAELVTLFQGKNMGARMFYSEITEETYRNISLDTPIPFTLPGCKKYHCIVFHADGHVEMTRDICDCDQCYNGQLSKCKFNHNYLIYPKVGRTRKRKDVVEDDVEESDTEESESGDDESDSDEDDDHENEYALLNALADDLIGNIIALQTHPDVEASFYLCQVKASYVADDIIFDSYEHKILPGQKYLHCFYLRKGDEKRNYTQYSLGNRNVYVLPGEIRMPYVNINEDLRLSNDEKQWIEDTLSRYGKRQSRR